MREKTSLSCRSDAFHTFLAFVLWICGLSLCCSLSGGVSSLLPAAAAPGAEEEEERKESWLPGSRSEKEADRDGALPPSLSASLSLRFVNAYLPPALPPSLSHQQQITAPKSLFCAHTHTFTHAGQLTHNMHAF